MSSTANNADACSHPVVYGGLCASCGVDLTRPTQAASGRGLQGHAALLQQQQQQQPLRRRGAAAAAAAGGNASAGASAPVVPVSQAWAPAAPSSVDPAAAAASAAASSSGHGAASGSLLASQAVVLGGAHRTIHLSASALRDSSRRNSVALLRSRRLMCVLDLDHTLLHATADQRVAQFVGREEDLFAFELPAGPPPPPATAASAAGGLKRPVPSTVPMKTHFVKLRPGLSVFLSTLAELFDLHVYTMGVRAYADAVVGVLDPTHRLIKHRVVSRDETGAVDPAHLQHGGQQQQAAVAASSAVAKSLKRMHPCDEGLVCIVDDRVDVWGPRQGKHVLRAFEFQCFSGRGAEMNARPQQQHQSAAERKRDAQMFSQHHPQVALKPSQLLPPKLSKEFAEALAAATAAGPTLPTPSPVAPITPPAANAAASAAAFAAASAPVAAAAGGGSKLKRRKAHSPAAAAPVEIQSTHVPYQRATASSAATSADDPIVIDGAGAAAAAVPSAAASAAAAVSMSPTRMELDDDGDDFKESDRNGAPKAISASSSSSSSSLTRPFATTAAPAGTASIGGGGGDNLDPEATELAALDAAMDATAALDAAVAPVDSFSPYDAFAARGEPLPIYPYMLSRHPCQDNVLYSLTNVLQAVHQLFYEAIDAQTQQQQQQGDAQQPSSPADALAELLPLSPTLCVPRLLALVRRSTLMGCVLLFSGVFPTNAGPVAQQDAWITAVAFGAKCVEEFPERMPQQASAAPGTKEDEEADVPVVPFGSTVAVAAGSSATASAASANLRVTHVVAARDGSAKLRYAHSLPADRRPQIVHVSWLWHSVAHFQRGDETKFPLWPEDNSNGSGNNSKDTNGDASKSAAATTTEATAAATKTTATTSQSSVAGKPAPVEALPKAESHATLPATAAATPAASARSSPAATPSAPPSAAATGSSATSAAPIRRRIPKKVPAPDATTAAAAANTTSSSSAAASPNGHASGAAAVSVAAPSTSKEVATSATPTSVSASTPAPKPVPGTIGLHLVHHVSSPPSVVSLVARVHALVAREHDQRNQGRAAAELVQAEEMVKAARLKDSMRKRGGETQRAAAVAATDDHAMAQETGTAHAHGRRKSVSFTAALTAGPSNPRFATDGVHTAPQWSVLDGDNNTNHSASSAGSLKRKSMMPTSSSSGATTPSSSFPLDDVERAKSARRLESSASASASAAAHGSSSSIARGARLVRRSDDLDDDGTAGISAAELYAAPDFVGGSSGGGNGGELNDADFDELAESLLDDLDQEDDAGGADYGDSERFDDDM